MFPIPFNFPFRKKDGSITTMDDAISSGGGSYILPTASAETKGGVKIGSGLSMSGETLNNSNPTPYSLPTASAETKGGVKIGSGLTMTGDVLSATGGVVDHGVYDTLLTKRPVFKPASVTSKYNIAVTELPIYSDIQSYSSGYQFDAANYDLNDVYLPNAFSNFEFYSYITAELISGLNLTLLGAISGTSANEITLNDAITNYSALVIQGCYYSAETSQYDTTMIYVNPLINTDYWFGMKDRNSSYGGVINFDTPTHGNLTASRFIKIYGIPKN